MIQLPDDVKEMGYIKTGSYQFSQIYQSKKHNFTGTEKEFLKAGIGYEYISIDKHSRLVITK